MFSKVRRHLNDRRAAVLDQCHLWSNASGSPDPRGWHRIGSTSLHAACTYGGCPGRQGSASRGRERSMKAVVNGGPGVMTVVRPNWTATGSAPIRLYVDSRRFLYDDRHSSVCRTAIWKTHGVYRCAACAGAPTHGASSMRQEIDGRGLTWTIRGAAKSKDNVSCIFNTA